MVELSPGSSVYVYVSHIERAARKKTPTSMACFLLSCFYADTELIGCNLTGANSKKRLNPGIVDSIICEYFACSYFFPNQFLSGSLFFVLIRLENNFQQIDRHVNILSDIKISQKHFMLQTDNFSPL